MSSEQRRHRIRQFGYKEGFRRVRQTSMSTLLKCCPLQNEFLHTCTRLLFPPNFKLAPFFTIAVMPRKSQAHLTSQMILLHNYDAQIGQTVGNVKRLVV